jgi:fluoroquinolone resistance protein
MAEIRKRRVVRITPPEAPETDGYAAEPPDLHGKFVHEDLRLRDMDLAEASASGVQLERVVMERVGLARANLRSAIVQDGRFDGCDMAGSVWDRAHLTRTELDGCRLVGAGFSRATFSDVRVRETNAEMVMFIGAIFTATRFERCNFRGASFEGADLRNVAFRGCDLRNADLRDARLDGTDLRGSNIAGLGLDLGKLRGLILDPTQAMDIVAQMGVTVKSMEEAEEA